MKPLFGPEEAASIVARVRSAARAHLGMDRSAYRLAARPYDNTRTAEPCEWTAVPCVQRAPLGDHVLRTWDGVWYDLNLRGES